MKPRVLLEVCVDDAQGLEAAVAGGADRIELCSALELGGLTPSPGLVDGARSSPVPVFALIRPRLGDFCYGPALIDTMRRDIDAVRDAGLAGVVLGASRSDFRLDRETLLLLSSQAQGMGRTLHRAFDLVPDFLEALETAIELGFERILTSGGAPTAWEGITVLETLAKAAAGRIRIMPGSGINAGVAAEIVKRTGAGEVHASCSVPARSPGEKIVALGFGSIRSRITDRRTVEGLYRVLQE